MVYFLLENRSQFGCILADCSSVQNQRTNTSRVRVPRQANKIAHHLARTSFSYARFQIWNVLLSRIQCLVSE